MFLDSVIENVLTEKHLSHSAFFCFSTLSNLWTFSLSAALAKTFVIESTPMEPDLHNTFWH